MAFSERISHTKTRYHRNPYCPLYVVGDYDCAVSGIGGVGALYVGVDTTECHLSCCMGIVGTFACGGVIIGIFSVGQRINMVQLEAPRKLGRLFSRGLTDCLVCHHRDYDAPCH